MGSGITGSTATPTLVVGTDVNGVAEIDTGSSSSCAVGVSGDVRCWGNGGYGRLGYGNTDNIGDGELPTDVGAVSVGGWTSKSTIASPFSSISS